MPLPVLQTLRLKAVELHSVTELSALTKLKASSYRWYCMYCLCCLGVAWSCELSFLPLPTSVILHPLRLQELVLTLGNQGMQSDDRADLWPILETLPNLTAVNVKWVRSVHLRL